MEWDSVKGKGRLSDKTKPVIMLQDLAGERLSRSQTDGVAAGVLKGR